MKLYNNAKPIGKYTKKELILLEHEWRLKLKRNGFNDIELWENNNNKKIKKVKFIKSHVRYRNKDAKSYWNKGFETAEFFRIIGIYSHNCKDCRFPEVLQHYSNSGSLIKSIKENNCKTPRRTVCNYILTKLPIMMNFVNNLENQYGE